MQNRRYFLKNSVLASAVATFPIRSLDAAPASKTFQLSLKCGMAQFGANLAEKFAELKKIGYDGIELNSPGGQNKEEALAASKSVGIPIHGVVNSIHWQTRLSDPDEAIREKSLQGLLTAIRESHAVGGTSVLLVPAVVDAKTTHDEAWSRSIEQIRKALPLAKELNIHILIENVWNQFLYDPQGSNNQNAKLLCKYIDEINSPLVGSYFDIGNHQKFGKPAEWIRELDKRIIKLDVKDWGVQGGFGKIGEGDVAWADVRAALKDIGYKGWATAEVTGGDAAACADILARMKKHLCGE